MPELMALKLLALARKVLRTSPRIKSHIEKIDIYIYIERERDRHKRSWTKSCAKAIGFYSRWITWDKPTLKASIDDISKKCKGLKVKMK